MNTVLKLKQRKVPNICNVFEQITSKAGRSIIYTLFDSSKLKCQVYSSQVIYTKAGSILMGTLFELTCTPQYRQTSLCP